MAISTMPGDGEDLHRRQECDIPRKGSTARGFTAGIIWAGAALVLIYLFAMGGIARACPLDPVTLFGKSMVDLVLYLSLAPITYVPIVGISFVVGLAAGIPNGRIGAIIFVLVGAAALLFGYYTGPDSCPSLVL